MSVKGNCVDDGESPKKLQWDRGGNTATVTVTGNSAITINQDEATTATLAHELYHSKQYKDHKGEKYKENNNPNDKSEWDKFGDGLEEGADEFEGEVEDDLSPPPPPPSGG